jgi:hypothetical protein
LVSWLAADSRAKASSGSRSSCVMTMPMAMPI